MGHMQGGGRREVSEDREEGKKEKRMQEQLWGFIILGVLVEGVTQKEEKEESKEERGVKENRKVRRKKMKERRRIERRRKRGEIRQKKRIMERNKWRKRIKELRWKMAGEEGESFGFMKQAWKKWKGGGGEGRESKYRAKRKEREHWEKKRRINSNYRQIAEDGHCLFRAFRTACRNLGVEVESSVEQLRKEVVKDAEGKGKGEEGIRREDREYDEEALRGVARAAAYGVGKGRVGRKGWGCDWAAHFLGKDME